VLCVKLGGIIILEQILLSRMYCPEARLIDENQNKNQNKQPLHGTALFLLFSLL
jgi:hypothetical protein